MLQGLDIAQALSQSSELLAMQVQGLVDKIDAGDRALARQLAEYVSDRPNRFTLMFAQELAQQSQPSTFVDVEAVATPVVEFCKWQEISQNACAGALMP